MPDPGIAWMPSGDGEQAGGTVRRVAARRRTILWAKV
jgi:hypothetical protein